MTKAPAVSPIVLTLPEPPSVNKLYRRGVKGHAHESSESRAYKEAVGMLTAKYRTNGQCAFPSGDLSITVLWYRSSKRGDLDNRLKVLLDALGGTLFRNDAQIAHIEACRIDNPAGPISTDSLKRGFMRVEISRLDKNGTAA